MPPRRCITTDTDAETNRAPAGNDRVATVTAEPMSALRRPGGHGADLGRRERRGGRRDGARGGDGEGRGDRGDPGGLGLIVPG
jgi:hypothetical protein